MPREIKAWAVVLKDDIFIPDFSVEGKFEDVLQIHSSKKSAEKLVKGLKEGWKVVECKITYENPKLIKE